MVRVVIIDDSAFMRRVIKDILVKNGIEVVAEAENGFVGLKYILELNPDVVLLDIEMPVLTGLDTLSLIMKKKATPVIMFSTLTKEGANITMEALRLGAVDFLHKPDSSMRIYEMEEALVEKIKTVAKANIKNGITIKKEERKNTVKSFIQGKVDKICVIGCSTGGPKALTNIFENLKEVRGSILIVQHMPPFFTKTLAKRIDELTPYLVKEAEDNEEIKKGVVYLAPGDFHMVVEEEKGGYVIKLNKQPPIHGCRPAVDYLFKSVAPIFKDRVLGCILTGMGRDGSDGCELIKKYGGKIYVESQETCTIYGMPKQVVDRNLADKVLPITSFAEEIKDFLK